MLQLCTYKFVAGEVVDHSTPTAAFLAASSDTGWPSGVLNNRVLSTCVVILFCASVAIRVLHISACLALLPEIELTYPSRPCSDPSLLPLRS
jgi:hypothetical protein